MLFDFVVLYGLRQQPPQQHQPQGKPTLGVSLLHCYPAPTPGNEPFGRAGDFCFPDLDNFQRSLQPLHNSAPNDPALPQNSVSPSPPPPSPPIPSTQQEREQNQDGGEQQQQQQQTQQQQQQQPPVENNASEQPQPPPLPPLPSTSPQRAKLSKIRPTRPPPARPVTENVTLLLTDQNGERHMAYGRRVVLSSPGLKYMREKSVCLCVLTRHAWPAFFRVALRRMVERLESERGWAAVEELAAAIRAAPLPDRGCHLIVQVPAPPPPATAVVVESENESESESEDSAKNECPGDGPEAEKEAPTVAVTLGRRPRDLLRPATESAQDLFQCLGSGGLVNVVVAALLERRVLVVGASMDRVSRAVLAICGLLYPFRWQHICVTLLVPQLLDYVYSPIPYILGIQRYHYEAVRSVLDDVVVVDLDAGTVTNATNYGAPEAVLLTSSGGSGGSYSGNSVAADPSMYPHVVAFRQSLFSVPPSSSSLLLRRKAGGNNSNNNGGLSDEKMGGGGGNKEDDDDDDDEDGGDERDSIGSRFCKFLAKTVGHYDMFFRREPFPMEGAGEKMRLFDTKTFLKFHSKSEKRFLKNFVNSQMFEQFIQEKEAELTDKGFLVRTQFDVDVDAGKKEPVGDGIHLYSAKLFKRVAFSDPVPPPRPPKPKFLTLNH